MVRHFLKTLTIFLFMIVFGLLGVFVLDYLENGSDNVADTTADSTIAN